MNQYKVEFSYYRNGKRVREIDVTYDWTAKEAAENIRKEYAYLLGIRIDQVWIDTGRSWELREFD